MSTPNDPFYLFGRSGTKDSPFKVYNEPLTVFEGRIILSEVPHQKNHVIVKYGTTIFGEVYDSGALTTDNVYFVDYGSGTVYFNNIHNGKQLTFTYTGEGYYNVPARRVYTQSDNGEPTQNLQDMIDNYNQLNGTDLYNLFDPQSGHKHTGAAGDAPPIDSIYINYNDGNGLITNVSDRLKSHDMQLEDIITIDIKSYGVKGDGVSDDTFAIQNAINNCPANAKLLFPIGTYIVNNTINITQPISIEGKFATIKAGSQGLNNALWIENANGVVIKDLYFDMALIGRTSIGVKTSTKVSVVGCDFTGYSADYGWSTYDGGVCFTDCHDILVENNRFHQHGNQYDATTSTLNRCITIQGTNGDRSKIIGNTFYQVNQAIAIDLGDSNYVANNIFEEVHDNSLYCYTNILVTGNVFNDKYDECLVFKTGNAVIVGNHFRNSPNKFIGLTGDMQSLIVKGNTFDNTGTTTGSFLAYRDTSYTISYCLIEGNIFLHPSMNNTGILPFYFGNITHLIMKDNIIKGNFGAFQKIIDFAGTSASGVIKDNYIEGSDPTSLAIQVETTVTSPDIIFDSNDIVNCRAILTGVIARGHLIQTNVGPYILAKNKRREVFYTVAPYSGQWNQGDLVWTPNPLPGGYMGWVCTVTGTACSTAWSASTTYSVGTNVYSNGNVYTCTQAGTSGIISLSGTSTSITDGGAKWQYASALSIFKAFGTIVS